MPTSKIGKYSISKEIMNSMNNKREIKKYNLNFELIDKTPPQIQPPSWSDLNRTSLKHP